MKKAILAVLIAGAAVAVFAAQSRTLAQAQTSDQHTNWTTSRNGREIRVETLGSFELTDDERDVKSVSPNGSFVLSSRGWLSLFGQRYIVRGNADGSVTRVFAMGASERAIDEAARAWIGDTLQQLVRNGFDADARVRRILAKQGPVGVLDAASTVSSDYVQSKYLRLLAEQAQFDRPTAERALRFAGQEIGSDFELARVLVALIRVVQIEDAMVPVFVEATLGIGSDFEHSRVLRALIAGQRHTAAVANAVLTSSETIGSDFEKSRVLRELAQASDLEAGSVLGLIRAAGSIGSDFEQSRVLRQIVSAQPLDPSNRQALIDTASRIGSDHERGRVLAAMIQGGARLQQD